MSAPNANRARDYGPDNWEEYEDLQAETERRRIWREQAELSDHEDNQ